MKSSPADHAPQDEVRQAAHFHQSVRERLPASAIDFPRLVLRPTEEEIWGLAGDAFIDGDADERFGNDLRGGVAMAVFVKCDDSEPLSAFMEPAASTRPTAAQNDADSDACGVYECHICLDTARIPLLRNVVIYVS